MRPPQRLERQLTTICFGAGCPRERTPADEQSPKRVPLLPRAWHCLLDPRGQFTDKSQPSGGGWETIALTGAGAANSNSRSHANRLKILLLANSNVLRAHVIQVVRAWPSPHWRVAYLPLSRQIAAELPLCPNRSRMRRFKSSEAPATGVATLWWAAREKRLPQRRYHA